MPKTLTVIRILVASPSDLKEERILLDAVIKELNLMWPQQLGISLELIKWETHTFPSAGIDPQDVINRQLLLDYDILLVMFWSKIGTPTPRFQSGTVEEFEAAYQRWQSNHESIRIMIYFKTSPISPDEIDTDQLRLVKDFRNSLSERGVLYSTFTSGEEFSQIVRVHLSKQVQDILKTSEIKIIPTTAPIAAIVTPETLLEKSVEFPGDEGFLDLIETVVTSSQRSTEVMHHISEALEQLNVGTKQSTMDIETIRGDNNAKLAAYKRISNRQAENMNDFVARMKPEIPILDDSLSISLDAYGRVMILLTDFGPTDENYSQLQDALSAATTLRGAMIPLRNSIEIFRSNVAALPRVTIQFNRAKRELLNLLDTLQVSFDRGIKLLGEIETIGKSISASWKPQSQLPVLNPDQQPHEPK